GPAGDTSSARSAIGHGLRPIDAPARGRNDAGAVDPQQTFGGRHSAGGHPAHWTLAGGCVCVTDQSPRQWGRRKMKVKTQNSKLKRSSKLDAQIPMAWSLAELKLDSWSLDFIFSFELWVWNFCQKTNAGGTR